ELARLHVPESELDLVAAQLSQVLAFAATLDELPLAEEPLTAFASPAAPLRADEPDGRTLDPETAVANAPEAEGGFFLVPPGVETAGPGAARRPRRAWVGPSPGGSRRARSPSASARAGCRRSPRRRAGSRRRGRAGSRTSTP